jgi:hypothetical protein
MVIFVIFVPCDIIPNAAAILTLCRARSRNLHAQSPMNEVEPDMPRYRFAQDHPGQALL